MLILQITTFVFALLGAWLLRKPGRWWAWAFVAWLVSNPVAMVFMAINGHWWLFAQHAVFLWLAGESTWHWLIAPRLFVWWDQSQHACFAPTDYEGRS